MAINAGLSRLDAARCVHRLAGVRGNVLVIVMCDQRPRGDNGDVVTVCCVQRSGMRARGVCRCAALSEHRCVQCAAGAATELNFCKVHLEQVYAHAG